MQALLENRAEVCLSMNQAQKSLQSARILHIAFLFASIAYALVAFYVGQAARPDVQMTVIAAIGMAATGFLGIAAFFRAKFVQAGAEALRNNADDPVASSQWRTGTIVSLAFAETVAMFGLVARFIGTPWKYSGIFFVVGILVLLAWTPRLDLAPR
jgi:F0F1-type ATP synthase membrane subunit c/vacuolar-type H+-ATPase subunit K